MNTKQQAQIQIEEQLRRRNTGPFREHQTAYRQAGWTEARPYQGDIESAHEAMCDVCGNYDMIAKAFRKNGQYALVYYCRTCFHDVEV